MAKSWQRILGLVAWYALGSLAMGDLELAARASSCTNDSIITIENGLQFITHCDFDYAYSDLDGMPISSDSLYTCCESCALSRPLCFGVAYNTTSAECWLKSGQEFPLTYGTDSVDSALVPPNMLTPNDTNCAYANESTVTVGGGDFTIYCNSDITGNDFYPNNTDYFHHADSFEDCLQICVYAHPFCVGVAYNPDMVDGYGNCYVKDSAQVSDLSAAVFSTHAAILQVPSISSSTCQNDEEYNSTSPPAVFDQFCDTTSGNSNMSALHANTFNECMDSCANNTRCAAVVWDELMSSGYSNCYLQDGTGSTTSSAIVYYATVVSRATGSPASSSSATATPSTSATTTSTPTPSGSSSSLAWIAGPVIGGLAVVGLLAAFIWWRRRRQHRGSDSTSTGYSPAWYNSKKGGIHAVHTELPTDHNILEMEARPSVAELPS